MKIFLLMLVFLFGLHAEAFRGTFITEPVFNASVYLTTVGNPDNPAVVLVHGLGDEASTIWESTIERLKNEYFVVTFDLPGFGQSTKSNELYSPLNYAKFIHFVAQTYVKKPFHLVGHSMGGAIALKYTSMYPTDVASLVLVDAAGILHRSEYNNFLVQSGVNTFFDEQNGLIQGLQTQKITSFIDKMAEKIDRKMALDMGRVLSSEDLRAAILGGSPHSIAAVALVEENFNGIPQTVGARTTIIWGENDSVAPVETGYVLHKLMPNASLNILPHTAHVPMLSNEEAFLSLLRAHLKNQEKSLRPTPPKVAQSYSVKIKDISERVYTGRIESMSVVNSQKITIKDAVIDELIVLNSDVEIINSTLKSGKPVALMAQNAKVSIVASDVFGKIKLQNTKLHLLGVTMDVLGKPIEALSTSMVYFSLCQINDKLIHGKEILGLR
ncbi:alpha/beta fold hydrolase [Sulfurospirillum halorespirans]|uniref:Putative alpha/beta hydrolase n=1 Tax=Sulfurospirillum halorespirans DSM 13726 TaxID=1193502 RepID=A0A1D7TNA4_9BACT|nr:alpha/beta hydrolase [Sulfurospirillum halorespirans]AOO66479.1 putative alpha/beta hydrolase [Sulfurospirillum halorespirans DSM 13726]